MSEKNFFRESAEDLPMKAGRLLRGEDQNVEFKESWQDEYLKWICGFANAQGGVLYVGVRDNGEVCGVGNAKKLIEDLPNYRIPDPEYTVHPNDIMLCFKTDSHKAQEDSGHTENHTENTVDTMLKILADEPRVTIARLCEMTRKSRSTITEHIAKLKAMNRIRRVGPDKGGHWEVVHG